MLTERLCARSSRMLQGVCRCQAWRALPLLTRCAPGQLCPKPALTSPSARHNKAACLSLRELRRWQCSAATDSSSSPPCLAIYSKPDCPLCDHLKVMPHQAASRCLCPGAEAGLQEKVQSVLTKTAFSDSPLRGTQLQVQPKGHSPAVLAHRRQLTLLRAR